MQVDEITALFTLAGLPPLRVWQLPNGYLGTRIPLTDDEISRDTPGTMGFMRTSKTGPTEGVVRQWMADYRWCHERPAWLVKTRLGLIQVTPRKRVIDLDWSETGLRGSVTAENVTQSPTNVHAWSVEKLLAYLTNLASWLPA